MKIIRAFLISALILSWFNVLHGFSGGSGTSGDPFQISNVNDLQEMNTKLDAYYVITNDIDASATSGWNSGAGFEPLGNSTTGFSGNINGNGYKIDGLFIDRPSEDKVGLFGVTDGGAAVTDLVITNCNITGSNETGGLVGYTEASTFDKCYVSGSISGDYAVGGIVGRGNSSFSECCSFGTANGNNDYIGGFIGYLDSPGTIDNSYSQSSADGLDEIGGFAGHNEGDITYCYSTGLVTATGKIGGFSALNTGSITSCYWDTDTSGLTKSEGGTGKTTVEMIQQATYLGWDFSIIWSIDEGDTYPYLQNIPENHPEPEFAGGDGSSGDPYQISTVQQLQNMKDHLSSYFVIINDIEASETYSWNSGSGFIPVGNDATPFRGNINGNYYTIDSLYVNRPTENKMGLIGMSVNGAYISHLKMTNCDITGHNEIGGITGYTEGSTFVKCYCEGTVSGDYAVGIFAGRNFKSEIVSCKSEGTAFANNNYSGGFIGYNENNVLNCYSTASASGVDYVAGFAGRNDGNITYCYSTGVPSGSGGIVGGFIGGNNGAATSCYWDTQTSGTSVSAAGTGKTTAEMMQQATFSGWDFSTPEWDMVETLTYPFLDWEPVTTLTFAVSPPGTGFINASTDDYPTDRDIELSAWTLPVSGFINWTDNTKAVLSTNEDFTYTVPESNTSITANFEVYFAGGDGTSGNPYEITNVNELQNVNEFLDAYYIVMNDIDASATSGWNSGAGFEPIGNDTNNFTGNFDGQDYVVSNLYINRPSAENIGLFGKSTTGAVITNLGCENIDITGNNQTGGLVGYVEDGNISNSYSTGTVTGSGGNVGGLIGRNEGSVADCHSTANVTGENYTGGLVGNNIGDLTQCYAEGTVSGMMYTGGFIGYNNSSVSDCYSHGDAQSRMGTTPCSVGGFIGWTSNNSNIVNCFSTGESVDLNSNGKGFVGSNNGSIIGCFWDIETSGWSSSDGGIGKTTAEMQDQRTFTNWNFDSIWSIYDGRTYPYLRSIDANIPADFAGGSGTSGDPYQITNVQELQNIESYLDSDFIIMNNINAATTSTWNSGDGFDPVGSATVAFTGTLNGGAYTLDSLYINRTSEDYNGIFGYISSTGTINGIVIKNADVSGRNLTGIMAGVSLGQIYACSSEGTVTGNGYSTGGLVGQNYGPSGHIYRSLFTGTVNSSGDYTGGLTGNNFHGNLINSYSTATVNGNTIVGGLAGRNYEGEITNCYSTGAVTGTSDTGGLTGTDVSGTVTSSYWDTETSGMSASASGTGKTTFQMHFVSTFSGWNFDTVWGIQEGKTYPYLRDIPENLPALFAGGDGSSGNPYQISDVNELQNIREYLNANYIIINDIDATQTNLWDNGFGFNPIGNDSTLFTGKLNGQGYAIDALFINRTNSYYTGLFANTSVAAEINNTGLTNCDISGSTYTGALAGYNNGSVNGCFSSGSILGLNRTGGLIGNNEGSVSESFSEATVECESLAGGLIGSNDNATVTNCYAHGDAAASIDYAGGFSGSDTQTIITNCYSSGFVSSPGTIGGFSAREVSGSYNSCFWDTQTSNTSVSAGGTGKTTSEMYQELTFTGWDFTTVWNIFEGLSYPYLRSILQSMPPVFAGGDGTSGDPYQISNAVQLQNIRLISTSQYFSIINDIDASETQSWNSGAGFEPISNFKGYIDGQGYEISGLYINRPSSDYAAIFELTYSFAEIKNIHISNIEVTGSMYAAGLAAWNNGLITDCSVEGTLSGSDYTGLISGYAVNSSQIIQCFSSGNVSGNGTTGGLIGYTSEAVTDCYSHADVNAPYAGGLIGYSYGAVVTNCYSTGTVTGNSIGGLVEEADNSTYTSCYWDTETAGTSVSSAGTGKTTAEMKQQSTYSGWDFTTPYWYINNANDGYPYLEWEDRTPAGIPANAAISISGSDITISWDAAPGATSYKIYASDDPYGSFSDITSSGTFNENSWTYTYTGTRRFYYVTGVNDSKDTGNVKIKMKQSIR